MLRKLLNRSSEAVRRRRYSKSFKAKASTGAAGAAEDTTQITQVQSTETQEQESTNSANNSNNNNSNNNNSGNNMADETTSLLNSGGNGGDDDNKEEPKKLSWSQVLMASHSDEHHELSSAAFLLRDAIIFSNSTSSIFDHKDYLVSSQPITGSGSSNSAFAKTCRKILTSRIVTTTLTIAILVLVLISFIEPPNWCRNFVSQGEDGTTYSGCRAAMEMRGVPAFYVDDTEDEIQYYYPSMRDDILNVQQAFITESIAVAILVVHTLLCIAKEGFSFTGFFMLNLDEKMDTLTSKTMKTIRIFRAIRITALILLAKGLFVQYFFTSSTMATVRPLAIFYRILLFIAYSEGVQRELLIAIEIIPQLFSVAVVLFMVTGFYGLIGVAAFYDTAEGTLHFSNWVEGIWTLWTSMTTVIYPDVMMAGYNENRFVPLFFVTFMMFTFFFLLNVMLAIVVNGYNSSNDAREKEAEETRNNYLSKAFDLMTAKSEEEYVTYDQLMAVFLVLNEECDEIPRIPQYQADVMFAMLDQDGTEKLNFDEFQNFTTVMMLKFEEVNPTLLERTFPSLETSETYEKLQEFVKSTIFDYAIDSIIVLNFAVVIVQSWPELAGQSAKENPKLEDGMIDTYWEVAETLFTLIYLLEMLAKVLLMGWKQYSSTVRNLFDGFITVLAVGAMIVVYYPNGYDNSHLVRFVVMSRIVRIFRLFMVIKPFKVMSRTFIGVLPAALRVGSLLFCVVYTFSAIGMHFFGGNITRDPNNPMSYVLEGTDFADNFYWANNFNDLLSGINVCFNLLVINNWNEMESGIIAISNKWSRYFFFFFFVCGVIIVNNLVVAIVVDFFFNELDEIDKEKDEEEKEARGGIKKLRRGGTSMLFDGEKLPEGKVHHRYVASVRTGMTGLQQKNMMNKLFV